MSVRCQPLHSRMIEQCEDIATMRALNFNVNDNNKPAPENIPPPDDQPAATKGMCSEWKGSAGVCAGHRFERAKLNGTNWQKS
jgi:hypothetical protein